MAYYVLRNQNKTINRAALWFPLLIENQKKIFSNLTSRYLFLLVVSVFLRLKAGRAVQQTQQNISSQTIDRHAELSVFRVLQNVTHYVK